MPASSKWKQVGWRTLKHMEAPKMVVRFSGGRGKPKLLCIETVPPATVGELVTEAEAQWKELHP